MAKAKAKWLVESTNRELLEIAKAGLEGEDAKKGAKAVDELLERTPDTDGEISVDDALENLTAATEAVKTAYQAELDAMDGEEEDNEEDNDDEEEDLSSMSKKDLVAKAKELGIKGAKKKEKDELIKLIQEAEDETEEDDDSEEDEDTPDYSNMTKKALLAECKERGIKANKKMSQDELIEALEADDEE